MKGGQSREVGSKESLGGGTKRGECKGRLIRGGFGGGKIFAYKVKVTESDG